MDTETTAATELLTDSLIRTLRNMAGAAGDLEMVAECDAALVDGCATAKAKIARAINAGRAAMDDEFVQVVA